MPDRSFSEVRISLNNGREIIADKCTDSGAKLVCEKMGGSFEVDKNDVLETKGITIEHAPVSEVSEKAKGQEAEAGEKEALKPEADTKGAEKQPGEGLGKGLTPEEKERLEQITSKKIEYLAERQRLINDRNQLQEDVKNVDSNNVDLNNQEKIDALNKSITELEIRLGKFNEDVRKLNEEEQNILGSSRDNK